MKKEYKKRRKQALKYLKRSSRMDKFQGRKKIKRGWLVFLSLVLSIFFSVLVAIISSILVVSLENLIGTNLEVGWSIAFVAIPTTFIVFYIQLRIDRKHRESNLFTYNYSIGRLYLLSSDWKIILFDIIKYRLLCNIIIWLKGWLYDTRKTGYGNVVIYSFLIVLDVLLLIAYESWRKRRTAGDLFTKAFMKNSTTNQRMIDTSNSYSELIKVINSSTYSCAPIGHLYCEEMEQCFASLLMHIEEGTSTIHQDDALISLLYGIAKPKFSAGNMSITTYLIFRCSLAFKATYSNRRFNISVSLLESMLHLYQKKKNQFLIIIEAILKNGKLDSFKDQITNDELIEHKKSLAELKDYLFACLKFLIECNKNIADCFEYSISEDNDISNGKVNYISFEASISFMNICEGYEWEKDAELFKNLNAKLTDWFN